MTERLAFLGAVVLAAMVATGCTSNAEGNPSGTGESAERSCAYPSVRAADGQSLTVSPGDSVALIAQDVADYGCPQPDANATEPPAITFANLDVLWTQSGEDVSVAEITSNGNPVEIEFTVPEDATPGPATVSVDEASLELDVGD